MKKSLFRIACGDELKGGIQEGEGKGSCWKKQDAKGELAIINGTSTVSSIT